MPTDPPTAAASNHPYPLYNTYERLRKRPSVLAQEYPAPAFRAGEHYYPPNAHLETHLTPTASQRFSAACLIGFLEDTVEVEHNLVIPAIAAVRRLPWNIPRAAERDLFKLATDEGFHAEQSRDFADRLRAHYSLAPSSPRAKPRRAPLFLRRLEAERNLLPERVDRDLVTVLNGVVTETRISIELGKFAVDARLAAEVRTLCRTHAADETVHASQCRALGQWLWAEFDEDTRDKAARMYLASTIARSAPDLDRIIDDFAECAGGSKRESRAIVRSACTIDALMERLGTETKSTLAFLESLGVGKYVSFDDAFFAESKRLAARLA